MKRYTVHVSRIGTIEVYAEDIPSAVAAFWRLAKLHMALPKGIDPSEYSMRVVEHNDALAPSVN